MISNLCFVFVLWVLCASVSYRQILMLHRNLMHRRHFRISQFFFLVLHISQSHTNSWNRQNRTENNLPLPFAYMVCSGLQGLFTRSHRWKPMHTHRLHRQSKIYRLVSESIIARWQKAILQSNTRIPKERDQRFDHLF